MTNQPLIPDDTQAGIGHSEMLLGMKLVDHPKDKLRCRLLATIYIFPQNLIEICAFLFRFFTFYFQGNTKIARRNPNVPAVHVVTGYPNVLA